MEDVWDVIVVGAGAAGLAQVRRLREDGMKVHGIEVAAGVGGTWYWNRYPGARCDVPSMDYSFQFDRELEEEWTWKERYAPQAEIFAYLNHVADRFDLRQEFSFGERVDSASFNEDANLWTTNTTVIETNEKKTYESRFLVLATGCLSKINEPQLEGQKDFKGNIYYTGRWPEEADIAGKRVGVIGTGSTAIQAIPMIAKEVSHLTVFQRTANYVIPARNRELTVDEVQSTKNSYPQRRAQQNNLPFALDINQNMKVFNDFTEEEYREEVAQRWEAGGFAFLGSCLDYIVNPEPQRITEEYVKERIADIVKDPRKREILTPKLPLVCKRMPLDTNYWETYNSDHVDLVSIADTPILRMTPNGIELEDGRQFNLDCLIFATGFDAMTGAVTSIDISGREGKKLAQEWKENGPTNYLGLCVSGYPNLFTITGPGSPSVASNMMFSIEQHTDYVADIVKMMKAKNLLSIEPELESQQKWTDMVTQIANATGFAQEGCKSWYLGSNIPGKKRQFMLYLGFDTYVKQCNDIAAGGYVGFKLA
uniref:Cyclohexanone monooxygenase n=1 Tax=Vannella robusta TaxID=1487602 RepID=A0A7S4I1U6_9EUKA|mmetsp:Transcript_19044/g.24064  ORF Transcript_19044/g.24064 Transcript_19044/m.24064 type:complete len:537 (+) Transcript_19044:141-1751(+)|eukprot:CAMPEP_0206193420 /NCGR_PEP_ID=MMETSP0166-20121206/6549_1 /ASSEMBLY_ACC=CAM_ASM_000260 /TAXON_ID=95228 /ORGANISM="Vannella robusta, Strain DIVA3 518/3/11/1/6" /LENGTH=536 /DNA_ID=CAMNT_0053610115 /DNA_START=120 /DNA_END=1730 /DNA_ORIENTATION=+